MEMQLGNLWLNHFIHSFIHSMLCVYWNAKHILSKTPLKLMSMNIINMQASPVICKNRVMTPSSFVLKLVAEGSLLVQINDNFNLFSPWSLATKKTLKQVSKRFLKYVGQHVIVCSSVFCLFTCFVLFLIQKIDKICQPKLVLFYSKLVLSNFLSSFQGWVNGLYHLFC